MAWRFPWGLLVLAILVLDALSLWWLFQAVREAGYGGVLAFLAVGAYAGLSVVVGLSVLASGIRGARGWRERLLTGGGSAAVVDGLLVLIAAVLVMIPGLATDVLAVLVLFPLTRPLFRAFVRKRAVITPEGGRFGFSMGMGRARRPGGDAQDVPRASASSENVDVDVDDYRVE